MILDLDISSTSCMSEIWCMSSQPHMSVSLTAYILVAWQYTQYGSMSRQNDHSGWIKQLHCCRGAVGVVVMGLNLHPTRTTSMHTKLAERASRLYWQLVLSADAIIMTPTGTNPSFLSFCQWSGCCSLFGCSFVNCCRTYLLVTAISPFICSLYSSTCFKVAASPSSSLCTFSTCSAPQQEVCWQCALCDSSWLQTLQSIRVTCAQPCRGNCTLGPLQHEVS